jgi:hypothetical protein
MQAFDGVFRNPVDEDDDRLPFLGGDGGGDQQRGRGSPDSKMFHEGKDTFSRQKLQTGCPDWILLLSLQAEITY